MSPPPPDPPHDDPFSALSLQLVSHGYLTRPLLLSSLLASLPSVPSSSSSSSSSLKKHQESLLLRARSLDQLTKLLWSLLERNQESREEVKETVERESRAVMEFEREKGMRERQERDNNTLARELEIERAKTKELETRLKQEQEKHKHVREELVKSRNALQFVKTQSLHDQKKREQEVTSLHLRLSKLSSTPSTSDPTTRLQILNSGSCSSPVSSASPTLSTLGGSRMGTIGRRNVSTPPPSAASNESTALLQSEIELLKSSLEELESNRVLISNENVEFRQFLGELGDWIERLLEEEPELNLLLSESQSEEADVGGGDEEAAVDPEREEARRLFEKLRLAREREQSEQIFTPPNPHLSDPPSLLLPQLDTKLYLLRLTLLSSLRSIERRLSAEKAQSRESIEREIELRDEALEAKKQVERELQEARGMVEEGKRMVEEFTERGKPRQSRLIGRDDSGDELPEEIVKDLEEKKKQKKLSKTANSKLATAEIEKPSTTSRPSIPSQSVQDFLGSLGLDTPVASGEGGGGKAALKSDKLTAASKKSSGSSSSRTSSARENEGRRSSGSTAASGSSGGTNAGSSSSGSKAATKEKETFKKPTIPARSVSSSTTTAATSTKSSTTATGGTSAALSSILSLAISPPPTSEPLTSTQLEQSRKPSTVSGKAVLGSSRAVNGRENGKTREEMIREKKMSLMSAAQRGGSSQEKRV
ncbi:uncharacterized protein JCM6883_005670 [Sporobolomyces salmoneus]|uniref:uncharacterized protein n=1 Tax=Sporobolomyces salmoneus TaxID=183962 RepID=UPI0031786A79